jgi:hypothetical protein
MVSASAGDGAVKRHSAIKAMTRILGCNERQYMGHLANDCKEIFERRMLAR